MGAIRIDIPQETFERLKEHARQAGKAPDVFTRELVEAALETREQTQPRTARQVLQAAGRTRTLSEALRRRIIPGVSLDEVRAAMNEAVGPSLSDIILEQRGPKP